MCGYTGIWYASDHNKIESSFIQSITNSITHRGPDEDGYYISGSLGLGFRRLSIIDLKTGHQPMSDLNEKIWVVFNGEIYNYKSLKSDLEHKGYIFKTKSDTEVIIYSYIEYGEGFVHHLRGMFSMAIWDKIANHLILIRDRFGIKPLYYSLNNERLVFGSELKSILKCNFSSKELDFQAIDSYFSYGYILSPLTIYKDIKKLSPGHMLIIHKNGDTLTGNLKRYWNPVLNEDKTIGFDDYKIQIRQKLRESIQAHLVSDVPVGAFLSGGIDSNAVLSQMVELYPDKVNTFSIGFKDNYFDEARLAKNSAAQFGTSHNELYIEPESATIIDDIVNIYDEPFADSSAIPTYFVSKLASNHVKVVLSGDGGDEFFGGYNIYRRLLEIQKYKSIIKLGGKAFNSISNILPSTTKGKRFLYSLSKSPDLIYAFNTQINDQERNSFYQPDVLRQIKSNEAVKIKLNHINTSNSRDYISRMMELDINTYMVDDILTKVDRASMANSLEVRVPIIDHEFFELAARIPTKMKIKGKTGKYIFREAFKDQIPDYIYNKKKSGFTIPIYKWFKNDLFTYYRDILMTSKDMNIINPNYIKNLIDVKDLGSLSTRIWPIITFVQWYNLVHKNNLY